MSHTSTIYFGDKNKRVKVVHNSDYSGGIEVRLDSDAVWVSKDSEDYVVIDYDFLEKLVVAKLKSDKIDRIGNMSDKDFLHSIKI